MWAVRRLNNPFRSGGLNIRTFRAVCGKSELSILGDDKAATDCYLPQVLRTECISLKQLYGTNDCFHGRCRFSSQAGVTDSEGEDDDLDDGFSELESSSVEIDGEVNKDELSDEEEEDVEEQSKELDLYDESEVHGAEKEYMEKRSSLTLFKTVMNSSSVEKSMDKWIEDGKEVQKVDINFVMVNLRKRRMYGRALQFSSGWNRGNRLNSSREITPQGWI